MSYNHSRVTHNGRFQSFAQEQMERARQIEADPDHAFWENKAHENAQKCIAIYGRETLNKMLDEKWPNNEFTYRELNDYYKSLLSRNDVDREQGQLPVGHNISFPVDVSNITIQQESI
jgi:hypothetical protein